VVLVTGCSSGIGRAALTVLAGRGYRVIASARRPGDADALQAQGWETLLLDLADPDSVAEAANDLLHLTGRRVYGLFNNGGYGQPGALEDLSREALRAQFETNVFGWHDLTCRLLPVMRAAGEGRIVQNSSVLGLVSLRFRGAYNASKHAVEALSDTLRMELAGSGVHVSLIEPGPVRSDFRVNARRMFERNVDRDASPFRDAYEAVLRRLSDPVDAPFTLLPEAVVARLVHALESPRPRPRYYVTVPTHVFGVLRRVLPTRALDAALLWVSRRETR
jgi:NAD(P)-dependent dehydrogenase (short-subunit alcohol dehydrogenase family)